MKIVVLDGYTENPGDLSWDGLKKYGELTVYDRTPYEDDEIIKRIGDAEIVLTNKAPLSSTTLDACPNIRCICVNLSRAILLRSKAQAMCTVP